MLELFNGGPAIDLQADKLALIVQGAIVESRSETVETRKKRSNKTVSEAMSATDESVIDIYSDNDPIGRRIRFGFDFSCLAEERACSPRRMSGGSPGGWQSRPRTRGLWKTRFMPPFAGRNLGAEVRKTVLACSGRASAGWR